MKKPGSHKARKTASARLGLALQRNYRALVEANGPEEVTAAAITLGDTFNTNVEFIINVLKDYGGLEAKFESLTRSNPQPVPANDLPDISALVNAPPVLDCICPPLEPGIIVANKHMTSCPQFVPAGA